MLIVNSAWKLLGFEYLCHIDVLAHQLEKRQSLNALRRYTLERVATLPRAYYQSCLMVATRAPAARRRSQVLHCTTRMII